MGRDEKEGRTRRPSDTSTKRSVSARTIRVRKRTTRRVCGYAHREEPQALPVARPQRSEPGVGSTGSGRHKTVPALTTSPHPPSSPRVAAKRKEAKQVIAQLCTSTRWNAGSTRQATLEVVVSSTDSARRCKCKGTAVRPALLLAQRRRAARNEMRGKRNKNPIRRSTVARDCPAHGEGSLPVRAGGRPRSERDASCSLLRSQCAVDESNANPSHARLCTCRGQKVFKPPLVYRRGANRAPRPHGSARRAESRARHVSQARRIVVPSPLLLLTPPQARKPGKDPQKNIAKAPSTSSGAPLPASPARPPAAGGCRSPLRSRGRGCVVQ
jgi:hypothetical protein